MLVLFDIWCVVLFESNFLKVLVMLDMNPGNVFTLVWY